MKTKKFLKVMLAIMAMTVNIVMLSTGESSAALQANQNTQYTKTDSITGWIKKIREMEVSGGTMGLNETLNTDLTASSASNNIDVHMVKSTEYGAVAILSASGYGNPSNKQSITTTTGNNTGVILNTSKWERVAGAKSTSSFFKGINSRYFDAYTSDRTSAKIGDALGTATTPNLGCSEWHSASYFSWIASHGSSISFIRGKGGIFSYAPEMDSSGFYSRGVAICGKGM